MFYLTLITIILLAVGCSESEEPAANTEVSAEVPAEVPAEVQAGAEAASSAGQSSNFLATQQAALKDAAAIQGILDKDAEEKKKAMEESN